MNFSDYNVRPVDERDRAFIDAQIATDPYHRGRMDASYFINTLPGEDAWAVENAQGVVVLYLRTKVVTRLAMLFGNQSNEENRDVLMKGVEWLTATLAENRFREIIFDTEAPALRVMAKRRLGFVEEEKLLVRAIPPPEIDKSMVEVWNRVPHVSEEEGVTANVRT